MCSDIYVCVKQTASIGFILNLPYARHARERDLMASIAGIKTNRFPVTSGDAGGYGYRSTEGVFVHASLQYRNIGAESGSSLSTP